MSTAKLLQTVECLYVDKNDRWQTNCQVGSIRIKPIIYFLIRNLRDKCRVMVDELRKQQNDFTPGFAVVQVGNREDSNVYIRHKLKAAEEIGIRSRLVRLDSSITERQVCLPKYSFKKIFAFL